MPEPDRPTAEQLVMWHTLSEAATPGPWTQDAYDITAEIPGGRPGGEVIVQCRPTVTRHVLQRRDEPNAAFIAAARTAIPALLREGEILARESQAVAEWGTEILTAVAQRLGLSISDLDAASGDDEELEMILGRLEAQTARLAALLPLARAASRVGRLCDNNRIYISAARIDDGAATAAVIEWKRVEDALSDDLRAELEGVDDADRGSPGRSGVALGHYSRPGSGE